MTLKRRATEKLNKKVLKLKKPSKIVQDYQFSEDNELPREDSFAELIGCLKSSRKIVKEILQTNSQNDETEENKSSDEDEVVETSDENDCGSDENNGNDEIYDSDKEEQTCDASNNSFKDPFKEHFEKYLSEEQVKSQTYTATKKKFSENFACDWYAGIEEMILRESGNKLMTEAFVKGKLLEQWELINKTKSNKKGSLTELQKQIFKHMGSYRDILFTERTTDNCEEIRRLYCLHIVNHILKTRSRILKNNSRLAAAAKENKEIDDCRDQGLTRPKVLIVVPFRNSCLKIVKNITKIALVTDSKVQVMKKKQFLREYSKNPDEKEMDPNKPDDFKATFQGNIDDDFILGLSLTKNTVKLFTPLYSADMIIASPLALRRIIGSDGEKQDFDFLCSIEILLMDQVDVFSMQNWEHVLHFLDHLHLLPKQSHGTDFSRVRMWCVDGLSKYYRQTLIFGSVQLAEIQSVFNKYCHNYNGKMKIYASEVSGTVERVATQTPQNFHRITCSSFHDCASKRFEYFIKKVLPEFRSQLSLSTAVFIPSYFDFVRVRNYFKKEEISFVQISEYSKRANITRSRSLFVEKKKHFILFSERFYFFYRYKLRGIKHIIFYDLPQYPNFYPEILNYMDDSPNEGSSPSCTIIYSRYDGYKLEAIVGKNKCKPMVASQKDSFMVVSGDK